MRQQKLAVQCGHWPLYRYRPAAGERPREEFILDSPAPSIPLEAYAYNEVRYRMLSLSRPDEARELLTLAQEDVHRRRLVYESLAERWPGQSTVANSQ
jgi:pyruvate-ferredoxin/flavodoxin oxidoreductase